MAFGKDETQKGRLAGGSFQQRAAYSGRKPERRSDGGGRSYWADNYKPSATIDTLRFVAAEYPVQEVDPITGQLLDTTLPWFPVREHYHGGLQRGALCSAGPHYMSRDKREACYGCEIHWEDFAERKRIKEQTGQRVQNPNRIGMTDKYVFTVVDQGTFYKVEQVDNNGAVRTNNQGQPFYEWKKLAFANDPAAVGRELKYGQTMAWPMNRPQFDMLQLFNESNVGKSCAGCGAFGNSMTPALREVQHVCANCKAVVVDIQTSTLSPLQINELVKAPYNCQHCGVRAFMNEVLTCMTCVQRGTTPRRASIFDVDIQVQMQQSPTDRTKQQLVILAYSAPMPINPSFQQLLTPLDLPSKFKPTSLEEQRKLWKIPEPGAVGQAPQGQVPPQHAQAPQQGGYPQGGYPQQGYPQQGGFPQQQQAPQGFAPAPGFATHGQPAAAAYQPPQQPGQPYQPYGGMQPAQQPVQGLPVQPGQQQFPYPPGTPQS